MGWVDRDEGVIELLDQTSTDAGVYLTIDCEDAPAVAKALMAALPALEEWSEGGDADAGDALGD
jgi:hypothetical protein